MLQKICFFLFVITSSQQLFAETDFVEASEVDFIHYRAELEPNFQSKTVSGTVDIEFIPVVSGIRQISFSAKYKSIKSIQVRNIGVKHKIKNDVLVITFDTPLVANQKYVVSAEYRASPERGMKFYDDHLFTVYHTKNWLISHSNIADKASFELLLKHNSNLISVGNGELVSQQQSNGKVISHWLHDTPMPIYSFGFALGKFEQSTRELGKYSVSYFYRKKRLDKFNHQNVKDVFRDVPDMLSFFEGKAGFKLPNLSYKYVIVEGYMAQEATGFSLVGEKFVDTVQQDPNENWFIAHELAHEWWGNNITCANFSHFWLNEGLVQFLVAAYKQHLFGQDAYEKEIEIAKKRVKAAIAKEKVSAVAFREQINESEINRTMAYSKGALVFYMLRNVLGDEVFWEALKHYSTKHKNGSVTTTDLRVAFEAVSRKDLTDFFSRWVYGDETPEFILKGKQH
ncbi:M1 family aminopeptidase [Pseudoalteromonas denitrificans]|uniref:Peptidase family M1 n=1 Tax=Pseudoalteromonas denitrificans DSM 6059 TaxID=1123010 RepID=A0A1I1IQZ1_9GAMM|nr:M1 family aminopeptidase [Pseudoalteromonas denitrificans]SFC36153.1 Peptidase family M1 [Pseudoalteromonas denitrificans DSM 6059]